MLEIYYLHKILKIMLLIVGDNEILNINKKIQKNFHKKY